MYVAPDLQEAAGTSQPITVGEVKSNGKVGDQDDREQDSSKKRDVFVEEMEARDQAHADELTAQASSYNVT